jgi:hypothetical protein
VSKHELWIHNLIEIKLLKFRFIQVSLQVEIRKIKKIRNIKSVKNIKTGYTAASYWSALFHCGRDGGTASEGGLQCWAPSQYWKSSLIYTLLVAM